MKKAVWVLFIIIIIVVIIFSYKYFNKSNNEVTDKTEVSVSTSEEFLLYIDEIFVQNDEIEVMGTIQSGNISVGNDVTITGLDKKSIDTKIIKIKVNNEEVNYAESSENICLTLDSNVTEDLIFVGQAIITPASTKSIYNIYVQIEESDLELSKIIEETNTFYINNNILCSASIISEEENKIKITLELPIVVKENLQVFLKNNDTVIATGIVINN